MHTHSSTCVEVKLSHVPICIISSFAKLFVSHACKQASNNVDNMGWPFYELTHKYFIYGLKKERGGGGSFAISQLIFGIAHRWWWDL